MKIICTQAQKEWVLDAFKASDRCGLDSELCGEVGCQDCIENSIEWQIEEEKIDDETKCPYGSKKCLCQTCKRSPLNNGGNFCIDNCHDCLKKCKKMHNITSCTGYEQVKDGDGE